MVGKWHRTNGVLKGSLGKDRALVKNPSYRSVPIEKGLTIFFWCIPASHMRLCVFLTYLENDSGWISPAVMTKKKDWWKGKKKNKKCVYGPDKNRQPTEWHTPYEKEGGKRLAVEAATILFNDELVPETLRQQGSGSILMNLPRCKNGKPFLFYTSIDQSNILPHCSRFQGRSKLW